MAATFGAREVVVLAPGLQVLQSSVPLPATVSAWQLPAASVFPSSTSPSTMSAWQFPAASSVAVSASVYAAVMHRNSRLFAAKVVPSLKQHEFGAWEDVTGLPPLPKVTGIGFSDAASPLPYCSSTCRDCPTSSRLLLHLNSLKLGHGTARWNSSDYCSESVAHEKSRWRRRGWKSRRRTRASAVSSEPNARKSSASEPMTAPFNVLITGSTKGIGYALAREFLRSGDNVVISSRSEDRLQTALKALRKEFGERVAGMTCDVRSGKSIQALSDFAKSQFGYIDIWINNAGTNAYSFKTLVESNDAAITEIVTTNTLGVMLCCRQAIRTMIDQPRGGHIFNMDGAGADGNATPRFAAYGATKRSLAQFTKSLQAELKQQSVKHVVVHNLSPGMVTTDLLMSGSDSRQAKFFINVLAEPAEVVAGYLVPRIRAIPGDKNKSSKYIRFLTGFKAYSQIISRLVFKARKDRFVTED